MTHKLCDPFSAVRVPYADYFFGTTGCQDSASGGESVDATLGTVAAFSHLDFLDFAFAVYVPENYFSVETP
jgi:hypothetical protein